MLKRKPSLRDKLYGSRQTEEVLKEPVTKPKPSVNYKKTNSKPKREKVKKVILAGKVVKKIKK